MKFFVVLASVLALTSAVEEVTVKTDKGTVKGIREDVEMGQYYYAFKGIRYAAPPTGKLRFKVSGFITETLKILNRNNMRILHVPSFRFPAGPETLVQCNKTLGTQVCLWFSMFYWPTCS